MAGLTRGGPSRSNSVADGSILGYTVMVGHTTVFDASRRQVGFAATPKC